MHYDEAIAYLRNAEKLGRPDLGLPLAAIEQRVRDLRQSADAAQHVIIRHGCVPGMNGTCRCDECRLVAQRMAEAGFLFTIRQAYRWWEHDPPIPVQRPHETMRHG